jgi:DNA-binding LytR/AlgR family response regulator
VEKEYTQIILGTGEKKSWVRKSLKIWEEELENFGFVRINEACLLNCRYIKNFEGYKVVLLNGKKMKVSRRRKSGCEEKFIEYSRKISIHG